MRNKRRNQPSRVILFNSLMSLLDHRFFLLLKSVFRLLKHFTPFYLYITFQIKHNKYEA